MTCSWTSRLWLLGILLLAPSLSAQPAVWFHETVPDTLPDYGFYRGAAFDSGGNLYIAYSAVTSTQRNATSVVRLIERSPGGVWSTPQTIDTLGATGISLAIDASGNPSVTESGSALHYLYQNPATHVWTTETVEKSAGNDVTSLAFDGSGLATVAYRVCGNGGNSAVKFARRTGANTWSKQIVDTGCNARYDSLAYDPQGNPGIAYSATCSGSVAINCLRYAHWDPLAHTWSPVTVEAGVSGYGTFANLAFDASGNPAITHSDTGVRYLKSSGGVWSLVKTLNTASGYANGAELNLDAQGNASIAFQDYASVLYATQTSGWQTTTLATGSPLWIINLRSPGSVPYILYYDSVLKKLFLLHQ